jgi:hypothetical protein
MELLDRPREYLRVKGISDLPIDGYKFSYTTKDDPNRPGDLTAQWVFVLAGGQWFAALV